MFVHKAFINLCKTYALTLFFSFLFCNQFYKGEIDFWARSLTPMWDKIYLKMSRFGALSRNKLNFWVSGLCLTQKSRWELSEMNMEILNWRMLCDSVIWTAIDVGHRWDGRCHTESWSIEASSALCPSCPLNILLHWNTSEYNCIIMHIHNYLTALLNFRTYTSQC